MSRTRIELDAQEAAAFIAWRQHQDIFQTLLDNGVFGISNGSAEIHFNSNGDIGSIDLHFKVFRKPVIPKPVNIAVVKTVVE